MRTFGIFSFCLTLCLLNNVVQSGSWNCDRNRNFKCHSGECISLDNLCDGAEHCSDGSDETSEFCQNYKCPKYLFRCTYGACIKAAFKCDGIKHCADNSDETLPNCNRPTTTAYKTTTESSGQVLLRSNFDEKAESSGQVLYSRSNFDEQDTPMKSPMVNDGPRIITADQDSSLKYCVLPQYPKNGKWQIFRYHGIKEPGDLVPNNWRLVYNCNSGYKLHPFPGIVTCDVHGNWNTTMCIKPCPAIHGNGKLAPQCSFKNKEISCLHPREGTIATLEQILDEDIFVSETVCSKGEWVKPSSLKLCVKNNLLEKIIEPLKNISMELGVYDKNTHNYPRLINPRMGIDD